MSRNPPIISHETYMQRLGRRFHADPLARLGLRLVVFLFLVAAFAPFLANSHAIFRIENGKVSFPIFRTLEPIEWRFLVYVPLGGLAFLFRRRWLPRLPIAIGCLVGFIVLVEVLLAWHHPFNDPTNDRDLASFKIMPLIHYSPIESTRDQFFPPSGKHWCGTDSTGRDIAARMLHGARTSLSIGFVSQSIALTIGVLLGGLAGYYKGWTDILVSRFVEIMDCFPPLLLILVVVGIFESQNNMFYIMAVIGLTSWTGVARLVRGEFLRLSGQSFTLAAQGVGATDMRVMFRHLLPNSLGPILVAGTFGVASAILIESSLSFLGFGMQAPTPSWGDILNESRRYIDFAWWLAFFPGLAILLTIMAYNFVGEGLRDAVDPRLQLK